MIDVETRARRAGEAARAEAVERVHGLEAPAGRSEEQRERHVVRRPLVGAVAGALVVLLVVLLVGQLAQPGTPTIEPAGPDLGDVSEPVAVDGVLPVPPVGDALPAYLEDGTPVFVSHPAAGDVRVVGAFNPHHHDWRTKLVAYCPSSGWFEDLIHGGRWNGWGDYTGGPAPSALPDHEAVVADDGATVRVTGEVEHRRPRSDRHAEQPQRGPNCEDGTTTAPEALAHEAPDELPAIDGTELPLDRWVWARIRLGGAPGDPRVCDHDGGCPQASPRLADALPGQIVTTLDGTWSGLVRRTSDGVLGAFLATDVPGFREGLDQVEGTAATEAVGLLPLPEPGEAIADWYGVRRDPVFVTRDEDGTVHVLDATSQHHERNLIGLCHSNGAFVDVHGARWTISGGYIGGPGRGDLRRYPAEVVTQGELRAVRVTGELGPELTRSEPGRESGPWCDTDGLLRHLPSERTWVAEAGGIHRRELGWRWVRMTIAEVDGQLRLCTVDGSGRCGEPEAERDPTSADCWDDLGADGLCPSDDPVVVTDHVPPTDGPQLLLVRASALGGGVEVRFPAEFDGV